MEHFAVRILNSHRVMAIATVRPDGWPQNTFVGYANRGFDLVFMIYRESQKLANIQHDDRIAIAVGGDPAELGQVQAVYAGACAEEITNEAERQEAWRQLMQRHSNLAGSKIPTATEAVFMKATCKYVSVLDYTQGLGHREQFIVDESGSPVPVDSLDDRWAGDAGR